MSNKRADYKDYRVALIKFDGTLYFLGYPFLHEFTYDLVVTCMKEFWQPCYTRINNKRPQWQTDEWGRVIMFLLDEE